MLGHRALTVQDYTTILKRRWWIIAIPAIIFPIIAFAITFLVQPVVCFANAGSGGAAEGSGVLRQSCRNGRPEWAAGYDEGADPEPVPAAADHRTLQFVCELRPVDGRSHRYDPQRTSASNRSSQRLREPMACPGSYISFKASDPRTAQLVCGEIESLFVSENLNDRAAVRGRNH